jgi:pyruvate dehydrogenase E2 component (dihydrolipoamide acetyltransferase)
MMRKTIAKRLVAAKSQAPHFYLTVSADMTQAIAWRQQLNAHPKVGDGTWVKISMNDLVLFAAARALRLHPTVNASWQEDAIVQHGAVHVAMAVALPTGLITPVLTNADQLGIRRLSEAAKALGKKAHKGELTAKEYEGGTFTVSNLGMTLVEEFTAIINPPQAAILAVGCIKKVPVVTAQETLGIQSRMKMTLSCDHRVIDGMVGAQFLETLVGYLEQPTQMLE